MDLTIAICTYRRPALLKLALESLTACDSIEASWELIVVDNDGNQPQSNPSANACADLANQLPLRYVVESETGTSHARNRAVKEAAAPIILFTDDDVTFDSQWLRHTWEAIQQQPQCQFWGGRVKPVWNSPKPSWFNAQYFPMLDDTIVQYNKGDLSRKWNAATDPPFYTANLAFRIDAINNVGGFDTTVGHRGDVRMGMEDSIMVRSIADTGGEGWYMADALVLHPVPEERTKKAFARSFVWRQGWLSAQLARKRNDEAFGPDGKLPRWFYRVAATEFCKGMLKTMTGLATLNAAKRFCGRLQMRFNFSRLYHGFRKLKTC